MKRLIIELHHMDVLLFTYLKYGSPFTIRSTTVVTTANSVGLGRIVPVVMSTLFTLRLQKNSLNRKSDSDVVINQEM